MSAHTLGPWEVFGENVYHADGRMCVATVNRNGFDSQDEVETNARLIAAAPDLLAACEAVLEWARTPGNHGGNPYRKAFVKLAGEAIAKAYGTVPGTGYVQDS